MMRPNENHAREMEEVVKDGTEGEREIMEFSSFFTVRKE